MGWHLHAPVFLFSFLLQLLITAAFFSFLFFFWRNSTHSIILSSIHWEIPDSSKTFLHLIVLFIFFLDWIRANRVVRDTREHCEFIIVEFEIDVGIECEEMRLFKAKTYG